QRRSTVAPAASASSAVPPREPSSATITSASRRPTRRARTVSPIRPSSSRAAMRIVSGSSTGRDDRPDRRQHRRVTGLQAVVAGCRAGEERREREAPDRKLEVVDAGDVLPAVDREGRGLLAALLGPDEERDLAE